MDKIAQLQEMIDQSQSIVFFGGAGVSTESNIPDFRSSDGVYSVQVGRHLTAEQLVSHTMFERYPEDFFDFYKIPMPSPMQPIAIWLVLKKLVSSRQL